MSKSLSVLFYGLIIKPFMGSEVAQQRYLVGDIFWALVLIVIFIWINIYFFKTLDGSKMNIKKGVFAFAVGFLDLFVIRELYRNFFG